MHLRLRDAGDGDFDELWRIDQRCFAPGIAYSRRELAWYMTQRGAFTLIGEVRDSPRAKWRTGGFLVGQKLRRGLAHIVTIDVLKETRRAGLGTRLMDEAEGRLKKLACTAIFLETAVDNDAAITFYKRRGYHVVKTIPRYYAGEIDALLMMKKLEPGL